MMRVISRGKRTMRRWSMLGKELRGHDESGEESGAEREDGKVIRLRNDLFGKISLRARRFGACNGRGESYLRFRRRHLSRREALHGLDRSFSDALSVGSHSAGDGLDGIVYKEANRCEASEIGYMMLLQDLL